MLKNFLLLGVCLAGHAFSLAQGLVFDDERYNKSARKAPMLRGDYSHLPDSASIKCYTPGPGKQLNDATSVGWALGWGARTALYAREHRLTNQEKIREHVFSPSFIYEVARDKEDTDCSRGITLEQGLNVLKQNGVPSIYDYFDFCGGEIHPEILRSAADYKITGYSKLFELTDPVDRKIQSVKKSLTENLPVVVGIIAPPSLRRAKEFWQPTEQPEDRFEGLALMVVGYNDNIYGGAFEVMNSWGKDWGNEGYLWIRYADFGRFVRYGYELFVMPDEKNENLSGEVILKLLSGNNMSVERVEDGYYKLKVALPSGVKFRLLISADQPAFVYAFASDLSKKCFQIFPHQEQISSALTYSSNHIAIPDEDHYIQLDNRPGTDYLCILYSREELDISSLLQKVERLPGDFNQRVTSALGSSLNRAASWEENTLSFSANTDNGVTVASIVEITHH